MEELLLRPVDAGARVIEPSVDVAVGTVIAGPATVGDGVGLGRCFTIVDVELVTLEYAVDGLKGASVSDPELEGSPPVLERLDVSGKPAAEVGDGSSAPVLERLDVSDKPAAEIEVESPDGLVETGMGLVGCSEPATVLEGAIALVGMSTYVTEVVAVQR